ncbi:MAG: DNA replication and repair protein RecF, partial [Actinobacteria bacterium]|nr:DNA replication and repair protein RecF [Actinomycetota bacterium]
MAGVYAARPSYPAALADALAAARTDDVRRGVTTVGPHRDELLLVVNELAARTHASQGEQRSLALALRLAGHGVVTDTIDTTPTLLLDDVFSELDPARSEALLAHLPPGQALLTTAGGIPSGARPAAVFRVADGVVTAGSP